MNTSSTIIQAYTTYMKTLPRSHDARANLCSLKKKIGEPAGTKLKFNQHKHNYDSLS